MIRINSGLYKGRVLRGGKSPLIRPTMSKVKLTFFDILQHDVKEKIFLDGFAGSGNIGIEALSRGAEYVVFIDDLPEAARAIRHNMEKIGIATRFLPRDLRRLQPLDHRPGQGWLPVRPDLPRPALRHARVRQPAEGHPQAQRAEAGRADRPGAAGAHTLRRRPISPGRAASISAASASTFSPTAIRQWARCLNPEFTADRGGGRCYDGNSESTRWWFPVRLARAGPVGPAAAFMLAGAGVSRWQRSLGKRSPDLHRRAETPQ